MNKEKLRALLAEYLKRKPEELQSEQELDTVYGLNSFDLFSLLVKIEEEFDFDIQDEALEQIHTVGDLEALVVWKEGSK